MRPLFCLILALSVLPSIGQTITTFAGQAPPPFIPFSGDGGPAVNAHLGDMFHGGMAFDAAGNMYITQRGNHRIRKVDLSGIITTIAGTGTAGYSGDGGPALNAALDQPGAIIVDNAGNIIFADQIEKVLRQIDPAGIITTISAPYTGACSGDGVPLSQAVVAEVYGLSTDNAGNIYVADQTCNTVRKISPSRIITTVAGNGTFGFSGDGGPATLAQLHSPGKVGIDPAGNLYIPDTYNWRIRKVTQGGIISTIGGDGVSNGAGDGGPVSSAEFVFPISICVDNAGNIYVAQHNGYEVRKIDPAGIITAYAGNTVFGYSGDGGPAIAAEISDVENIGLDASGNLYIVDYDNQVIRKVSHCLAPTYSVQPTPESLCASGNASFTVNASGSNSLHWQGNTGTGWVDLSDNGTYSGSGTNTLIITAVVSTMNNNQFRCVATNACGNDYSQPAMLTVLPPVTPAIAISTLSQAICSGVNANFQATASNGGTSPTYQWQKNGNPVGSNSPTYSDPDLVNGDIITCQLVSNSTCVTTSGATSNPFTVVLSPNPAVKLDQDPDLCAGDSRILDPGKYTSYFWSDGSSAETLTITDPGTYSVTVTDPNGCKGTGSTTISTLLPPPGHFLPSDTSMCKYGSIQLKAKNGYTNYQWSDNSFGPSITITKPGQYWLEVTDNNNCKARDTIIVAQKDCLQGFFCPGAFTPNHDGNNDYFKPLVLGNIAKYQFSIFNRWGQAVFQSNNPEQGWDGSMKGQMQPAGTFAWICTYQFAGSPVVTAKGTVILIR